MLSTMRVFIVMLAFVKPVTALQSGQKSHGRNMGTVYGKKKYNTTDSGFTWVLGALGDSWFSCTELCNKAGLDCINSELSKVTSKSELSKALESAGESLEICDEFLYYDYYYSPSVYVSPKRHVNICNIPEEGNKTTCARRSAGAGRLCPCAPPGSPCAQSGICTISEDPHIDVFDGVKVSLFATAWREVEKARSVDGAGNKWLVNSGQVSIQARYMARDDLPDRTLFVRAIAVGGTFLHGSSLIIGALEDQITWNGQAILLENESYFATKEGEVSVKAIRGEKSLLVQDLSKEHRGVTIELPLGVSLIVNRLHKYLNVAIKMPPQEDQEGLCGNFNGISSDDSLEIASARFDTNVNPEASLFEGLTFS